MNQFEKMPLGREIPKDFDHVTQFPYADMLEEIIPTVEKVLQLPSWNLDWNQGSEGACVGFGTSMMNSILKMQTEIKNNEAEDDILFDPFWLWQQAKNIDGMGDPTAQRGTTVRAACDVLRTLGDVKKVNGEDQPVDINLGIAANRWAVSVDEVRSAVASGVPCSIGISWYTNFDKPVQKGADYWIGHGNLGSIRGGHCVCLFGASDKRQAFCLKNSWGGAYPIVWIPYLTFEKLLKEQGECTLVTDR